MGYRAPEGLSCEGFLWPSLQPWRILKRAHHCECAGSDNPVISTVDLLVDVVPAEKAPTDEISIIESVQLSQYEADIDEAEERSIVEQSRETDENSLSQPGCSHWPRTQNSTQAGPPPGPATIFRDCSANVSSEADNHENNRSGDNVLCDLGFREDSLPVKRQKLERYQLFMLEPEQFYLSIGLVETVDGSLGILR